MELAFDGLKRSMRAIHRGRPAPTAPPKRLSMESSQAGRVPTPREVWRALLGLPAFWLGLGVRLALLPYPTSKVSQTLFEPFLNASLLTPGQNPWRLLPTSYFPYGTVLWALLMVPRWLVSAVLGSDAVVQQAAVSQGLIKLSMLGCDAAMLFMLCRLSPKRESPMVALYWLNPVLIYITYVHGQLDVAASMFAMAGLTALLHGHALGSGLLWAAASLCKAHVAFAVPFLLAFIYKQEFLRPALRKMATFTCAWGAAFALGLWPHVAAGAFGYVTATSPEALRLFGMHMDMGNGHVLLLGPAVATLLLGRLCISPQISQMGLLMGTGMLFGTLSLVTGAMPGWYFWSLPTVCLFYVHYLVAPRFLLLTFCVLYLAYFGAHDAGTWHVASLFSQGAFTLVQTAYASLLIALWLLACRRETPLYGQGRPLMLGIAGDSGTGKNLFSDVTLDVFARDRAAVLEGDDYHKWERGNAKWADYTHLHPKANALDALALHTSALVGGRHVWQPHYDHGSGTFTEPRRIGAAHVVLVQGLHTLYLRDMRAQLDLKVFLAPDELVRLAWKVRRDVTERGHDRQKVLESIARRRADADLHIHPQRQLADWTIIAAPAVPTTRDAILAGHMPALTMHHILWNDAPITELFGVLTQTGLDATLNVEKNDIDRIRLSVTGELSAAQVAAIGERILAPLRVITRASRPPVWRAGQHGVNQLILLSLLGKRGLRDTLYGAYR